MALPTKRKKTPEKYKGFEKRKRTETSSEHCYIDGTYVYNFPCSSCDYIYKKRKEKGCEKKEGQCQSVLFYFPKVEFKWVCPYCNEEIIVFCRRSVHHSEFKKHQNII